MRPLCVRSTPPLRTAASLPHPSRATPLDPLGRCVERPVQAAPPWASRAKEPAVHEQVVLLPVVVGRRLVPQDTVLFNDTIYYNILYHATSRDEYNENSRGEYYEDPLEI